MTKNSINIPLPTYIMKSYNYNPEYTSIISTTNIKYPETYKNVLQRTKKILEYILSNYYNTNCNILIVTHQTTCKCIIDIINKLLINKSKNNKLIYKQGELTLIFDNDYFLIKKIT